MAADVTVGYGEEAGGAEQLQRDNRHVSVMHQNVIFSIVFQFVNKKVNIKMISLHLHSSSSKDLKGTLWSFFYQKLSNVNKSESSLTIFAS